MTTGRRCGAEAPSTEPGVQPDVNLTTGTDDPRSTVLVLRVWREGDELRCRLLGARPPSSTLSAVLVVQGLDAICEAVRKWLSVL
jgi:hypothetical protein